MNDAEYRGQAMYTRRFLAIYDALVLGLFCSWIWRCPARRMLALYDENVRSRHLDIGVGTGYFLDKCRVASERPEITLMDLNADALATASARIHRYSPHTHRASALEPFGLAADRYDSVALNLLLHCLPGDIESKATVLDHCKEVLAPGGVVFGSTVLNGGVRHTWMSRRALERLNRQGTFCNLEDTLDALEEALANRFPWHDISTCGTMAVFAART